METIRAAFSLMRKDIKSWFRTPAHVLVCFAPVIIVMALLGSVIGGSQTMPVGVLMDNPDDILSKQYAETVADIKTAHFNWFEVRTTNREEAEALFKQNELLAIIEIPDITKKLESGSSAQIQLRIQNLNNDLTKNFRQRVQEACIVFNSTHNNIIGVPTSPTVKADFRTFLPVDLHALVFFGAGLIAMAIIMGGINNAASLTAREFEEGTYKELALAPNTASIILGKWLAATIQTLISVSIIWILAVIFCRFTFDHSFIPLLLLVIIGSLSFAGVGTLLGLYFKQVIPAGVTGIILSVVGWWFGGTIWIEIWPKVIQDISVVLPTTYLIRAFTRASLLGLYTTYWSDLAVLAVFGIVTAIPAYFTLKGRIAR